MYLKSAVKGRVNLGKILPTIDAIQQHLKRVYLQVQDWLHGDQVTMDPSEWGWMRKKDDTLVPVQMTQKPAPDDILELIFCGCAGNCDRMSCSCRKHGLPCNVACKNCEGSSCTNTDEYSVETLIAAESEALDEEDCRLHNMSVIEEENEKSSDVSFDDGVDIQQRI